MRKKYSWII